MRLKKTLLVIGLLLSFTLIIPTSQVLAGGGPEPPADAVIQDDEIWGEVTVYCSASTQDFAVVRVKRVVDCNVETQTVAEPAWNFGCTDDPTAPLDWSLAGITFFNIAGEPYIAKVKHWQKDTQAAGGDAYSFDAMFKFWLPGP